MTPKSDLRQDFNNFVTFVTEGKLLSASQFVTSTVNILRDSPPTRRTILELYGNLFEEYCSYYIPTFYGSKDIRLGNLLNQLKQGSRTNPKTGSIDRKRLSSDRRSSLNEPSTSNAMDTTTPASPPQAGNADNNEDITDDGDDNSDIEDAIQQISMALLDVSSSCNIADWSLNLVCTLSCKFSEIRYQFAIAVDSETAKGLHDLSETIKFWTKCPVISLLLQLVTNSINAKHIKYEDVLIKITNFKLEDVSVDSAIERKTDWICCYILTSIPSSDIDSFSSCIEYLMKSTSNITSVLSYLSLHNPKAIINSSRNNVTFLLELCHNSKPLLDLLSKEAIKGSNIELLNDIVPKLSEDVIKNHVLFCVLNAFNSYQLLSLTFEIVVNPKADPIVKQRGFALLSAVISKIHEHVYLRTLPQLPIMEQLRDHVEDLIAHPSFKTSPNLSKIQLRLLALVSVHCGTTLMNKILFEMMNQMKPDVDDHKKQTMSMIQPQPVICAFLHSLRLPFGANIHQVFNRVLKLDDKRNSTFWYNLISYVDEESKYEVDIDLLTNHLSDNTFQPIVGGDQLQDDFEILLLVLRLIDLVSEKYHKQITRPKHNLCIALVVNYVNLVTAIQNGKIKPGSEMEQVMSILCLSQKIMSQLSSKYSTNQHILTRAFMDCIIVGSESSDSDIYSMSDDMIGALKDENMRHTGPQASHKFKKMPLNPFKKHVFLREREANAEETKCQIANQLLLDAIKSCVVHVHDFAMLLVEVVTPDVMFNDLSWPEEDFLKVTIERDLHISRQFQTHEILWDLCTLIATQGDLRDVTVLIRALMAVQLTQWASATASKEKGLESTQRLIHLVSKGKLVPEVPFKYIPSVLENLTTWEIFCVLNDLWRLLRDTSISSQVTSLKPYLERLRTIMSHSCPGPLYVKIFKNLK